VARPLPKNPTVLRLTFGVIVGVVTFGFVCVLDGFLSWLSTKLSRPRTCSSWFWRLGAVASPLVGLGGRVSSVGLGGRVGRGV